MSSNNVYFLIWVFGYSVSTILQQHESRRRQVIDFDGFSGALVVQLFPTGGDMGADARGPRRLVARVPLTVRDGNVEVLAVLPHPHGTQAFFRVGARGFAEAFGRRRAHGFGTRGGGPECGLGQHLKRDTPLGRFFGFPRGTAKRGWHVDITTEDLIQHDKLGSESEIRNVVGA